MADFPSADKVLTTQLDNIHRNENHVFIVLREIFAELQKCIYNGSSDTFVVLSIDGDTPQNVLDEVAKHLREKGFKFNYNKPYWNGCGDNTRDMKISWTPKKRK